MKNNYRLNVNDFGTHQIIAKSIGTNKTVLDVGCNTGYLAKLSPLNHFHGIDYTKKLTSKALVAGYKKVHTGDLNKFNSLEVNGKYDVLVFGDILEHLNHPDKVLSFLVKNHLKKRGRVIISLPNVAHLSIRLSLLLGQFNYTKAGILDKTHLHLYTLETGKMLAKKAGLKIMQTKFSSNNFGWLINMFPFLGTLLGFNLIYICRKL